MSTVVVDVLYIKMIERTIRRPLDELDIECIKFGEPIFVQKPSGEWASFIVPLYRLPDDLMPDAVDLIAINSKQFNPNPWSFAHDNVITSAKMDIARMIKGEYEE